jgi:hypothetical protein
MSRLLCLAGVAVVLAGCQVAPEATPLTILPENRPYAYAELLTRARDHAKAANEATYIDQWGLLEDAARCLEQDARLMPTSQDRPAKFKPDQLQGLSRDLADGAVKLREAARSKDPAAATEAMTLVNRKVREMKLGD